MDLFYLIMEYSYKIAVCQSKQKADGYSLPCLFYPVNRIVDFLGKSPAGGSSGTKPGSVIPPNRLCCPCVWLLSDIQAHNGRSLLIRLKRRYRKAASSIALMISFIAYSAISMCLAFHNNRTAEKQCFSADSFFKAALTVYLTE